MPGNVLEEIAKNHRIIGASTAEAAARAAELYRAFVSGEIHTTDITTAELCKLMENTFRDVNIALANEFSLVCEKVGVDVEEAIELCNKHPRVMIHHPGIGVGGHCIPVVPWFIVQVAPELTPLIRTARKTNDHMPMVTADRIERDMKKKGLRRRGTRIGIIGLTYKPDVDDFRESPAIEVARELGRRGYRVGVWDPSLNTNSIQHLGGLVVQTREKVLQNDYVVELVRHTSSAVAANSKLT
jgi:nucleotide sugar dehydrogenase